MRTPLLDIKVFKVKRQDGNGIDEAFLDKLTRDNPLPPTTELMPVTIGFLPIFDQVLPKPIWALGTSEHVVISVGMEERKPTGGQITRRYMQLLSKINSDEPLSRSKIRELRQQAKQELLKEIDPESSDFLLVFLPKRNELWMGTCNDSAIKQCQTFLSGKGFVLLENPISLTLNSQLAEFIRSPSSLPSGFALGHSAALKDSQTKSSSSHSNQDLSTEEVHKNLDFHKLPTRMQLIYKDAVRFEVSDKQIIRRLKDFDEVEGMPEYDEREDETEAMFVNPILHRVTLLSFMVPKIYDIFGGVESGNDYGVFSVSANEP